MNNTENESGFRSYLFSGMRPTGIPHYGNYFGAIRPFTENQTSNSLFCIADLHALTEVHDSRWNPVELRDKTYLTAAYLLASGVRPENLYLQSHVNAHVRIGWIMTCLSKTGELARMTQYKDRSDQGSTSVSAGIFAYPALMAADITVFGPQYVPVGKDQHQHLEHARAVIARLNAIAGREVVAVPQGLGHRSPVICSLRDASKMSKSAQSDMTRINLSDTEDMVNEKIMKARTDSAPTVGDPRNAPGREGTRNLIALLAAVSGASEESVIADLHDKRMVDLKRALIGQINNHLQEIRQNVKPYLDDRSQLHDLLVKNGQRLADEADAFARLVECIFGLVPAWERRTGHELGR